MWGSSSGPVYIDDNVYILININFLPSQKKEKNKNIGSQL